MVAQPRIFVGTLSCGENEFADCQQAIRDQEGVEVTHHVISNLPELEAHNELWTSWSQVKDRHDLFVKVDADTVLSRKSALKEIANLFLDPNVTGAQILLHDYFSNRLIAGLNAFSPTVVFKNSGSRLYADRADHNHRCVLKGKSVAHLAPIGWHCPNPHPKQAFHFGFHRALKKQWDILSHCADTWLKDKDEARSWAITGSMAVGWGFVKKVDYGSQGFENSFLKYQSDEQRLTKVEEHAKKLIKKGQSR